MLLVLPDTYGRAEYRVNVLCGRLAWHHTRSDGEVLLRIYKRRIFCYLDVLVSMAPAKRVPPAEDRHD